MPKRDDCRLERREAFQVQNSAYGLLRPAPGLRTGRLLFYEHPMVFILMKGEVASMSKALRRRFWLETVLGVVTGILFVITLVWHDWIEIIFNVDPDQGNGSLEWLIVAALLVVTIILFILASYEFRKARIAIG